METGVFGGRPFFFMPTPPVSPPTPPPRSTRPASQTLAPQTPASQPPVASRRPLVWLLNGAIVFGVLMASLPLAQTLYGHWSQHQLQEQWQEQKASAAKPKPERVTMAPSISKKAVRKSPAKWPLTKLSIPDIDLETYAVQGWDEDSLRRGPGHDPQSAPPGEGNCVLAGHRNIYGSYFYQVDRLMPGSPIILENRQGRFVYITARVFTTTDGDYSIRQQPAPGTSPLLTLITCTMPHTSNRIIVQAVLQQ